MADSLEEPSLEVRRFNEGPAYAARKTEAMRRLAGVRHKGLELDTVLCYVVSGSITDDVGEPLRWPVRLAKTVKGFLGDMRRNRVLRDVAIRPTLQLQAVSGGDGEGYVWVFTDASRATVDAQLGRVIGDAPHVKFELGEPSRVPVWGLVPRLLAYVSLFVRCIQPFRVDSFSRNHELAVSALRAGDIAEQARALFRLSRPAGIFIYRDIITEGNVLVQVAKQHGIPTYSTQHAIYPELQVPNHRVGSDIAFQNTFSDTYVCWGEFSHQQMASFPVPRATSRRVLVHSRPTSSDERQVIMDRGSRDPIRVELLMVSLMGLRHEEENAAILRLAMEFAHLRALDVSVRPHPSLNRDKYVRFVDGLRVRFPAEVEVTNSRIEMHPAYGPSALGLTGMTSMYYENLFFGIPVIFYDHDHEVFKPLPRVMPGVRDLTELEAQVARIEAMTWKQWYELADPLCELTYNRRCGDFAERDSMIDLVVADALRAAPVTILGARTANR